MTEHIQKTLADGILLLRFARPDKKNALTQAMYAALAQEFRGAATDKAVRVVVLAGQADCFTSGNDMKDFMAIPKDAKSFPTVEFMQAMAECPKPIVAAAAGLAIGVGVTLMLHCDLVYAGEHTRMSMPFSSIGIRPEFASSYLLPRIMGHVRASELLLLGEFTAQKAYEYGLVNAVVPNADVEQLALEKARAIAQLPPTTTREIKAMLKRWRSDVVSGAIPWEMGEVGKSLAMPEAMESISAFLQKRKPDFSKFS